jgi:hypothetical protein
VVVGNGIPYRIHNGLGRMFTPYDARKNKSGKGDLIFLEKVASNGREFGKTDCVLFRLWHGLGVEVKI